MSLLRALRCPDCGTGLSGRGADRIHSCVPCSRAWDLLSMSPARYDSGVITEALPGDALLPFWAVDLDVRFTSHEPGLLERVARVPIPSRFLVPAFQVARLEYFLDPLWMQCADALPSWQPIPWPLHGVSRSPEAAVREAGFLALLAADRHVDVTGLEVSFAPGQIRLAWMPFRPAGDLWTSRLGPVRLPAGVIASAGRQD